MAVPGARAFLAGLDVPQSEDLIAQRRQDLAVGTEGRGDGVVVRPDEGDLPARFHVPDTDTIVVASAGQCLTVAAERQADGVVLAPRKG